MATGNINIVTRLQRWMDSIPGQTFLNYAYSWGASIVILGALFKLTHLYGADLMLFIGMGTEVVVFFLSAFDRPFTRDDASLDFSRHNLCTKAICKLREAFGFKDNFVVNIHKEIPFAAGLGGGSSNAAAVMKAIVNILQLKADDEMLNEIGLQIGADVPFFLKMHPSIVTGIGEKLQPIPVAKSFLCLLVKPVKGLSTKKVFETYDERKPENLQIDTKRIVEALAAGDQETLSHTIGNDL